MTKEPVSLEFPYVKSLTHNPITKEWGEAYRPIISVRLITGDRNYKFEGLVDSGADECTFPGEIARVLGHNLLKGKPKIFTGIGGSVIAYLHKTIIEVGGHRFKCNIYYSDEWNNMPFGLLGQSGFFSRFEVIFNYKSKILKLTYKK